MFVDVYEVANDILSLYTTYIECELEARGLKPE